MPPLFIDLFPSLRVLRHTPQAVGGWLSIEKDFTGKFGNVVISTPAKVLGVLGFPVILQLNFRLLMFARVAGLCCITIFEHIVCVAAFMLTDTAVFRAVTARAGISVIFVTSYLSICCNT